MEDRNIAYSLWNELQGDGWQLRLPRRKARRQKTSCIKSKLLWGMMRVEKWKSTMEQNTMSGRMKKWRHYRLQLKVGSIWNIHSTVRQFYSSASKRIGRKLDDWNPTNRVFSESQYLAVFKYRLHFLILSTELELERDEYGWPLTPHSALCLRNFQLWWRSAENWKVVWWSYWYHLEANSV